MPQDQLKTADGKVSGGGKVISYGDVVKHQELKLTIPVTGDLTSIFGLQISGDPPLKPASELKVVGKSYKNSIVSAKVRHEELWGTNVKLPGRRTAVSSIRLPSDRGWSRLALSIRPGFPTRRSS